MKKTKKKLKFTLIEVLIAIVLTTGACFFLLEFEESYIKNTRQSLLKVKRERLIQEAYVTFLELLYTNQVPWKLVEDQKSYNFPLSDPDWEAEANFSQIPHGENEEVSQNLMDVEARLTLIHRSERQDKPKQPKIRLCFKKEERIHVETPQT